MTLRLFRRLTRALSRPAPRRRAPAHLGVEALEGRSLPSVNPPLYVVPVHAIQVAKTDGTRPANITPGQVKQWVDKANEIYAVAGIQLQFDPNNPADFTPLYNTAINQMTGDGGGWAAQKAAASAEASRYPGQLVVFFRWGPDPSVLTTGPTGGGFSGGDLNFVAMPGFNDTGINGHQNIQLFAHEVGHYLGLDHTFAKEFETVKDAEDYYVLNGRNDAVFDGDKLADTPPDPQIKQPNTEILTTGTVTLAGRNFPLPTKNIMSYYDATAFTMTPLQILKVREWVRARGLGQVWSGEEFLGGTPSSAPAVTSWGANRQDVFYRGANNHLTQRAVINGSWTGEIDLHNYESATPNAGLLTSKPAAVAWDASRIDIVYRGVNNHLYHRSNIGGGWTTEVDVGGVLTSAPALASWGPGRLDVFYRGQNSHLWHRWYANGGWSYEEDLGGTLTSDPTAVSWGPGRIDIFYRNGSNHLGQIAWTGSGWTGEYDLSGTLNGAPTASAYEANRLDVFYRGSDNHVWHRWWDGVAWRGGQDVGGVLASDPGVVSVVPGRFDTYYMGQNLGLWHRTSTLLTGTVGADANGYVASGFTGYGDTRLSAGAGAVGTLLYGTDDASVPLSLGAQTFRFYGTTYSTLYVSSNGLITFGSANASYSNGDLTGGPAEGAIAPLWDDYIQTSGVPMVLYRFQDTTGDGAPDRLVVQWDNVFPYGSARTNGITFQAILGLNGSASGSITFNYFDLDAGDARFNNGASATVGIKAPGTPGGNRLLVSANALNPFVASNRAVALAHASAAPPVSFVLPNFYNTNGGTASQSGGTARRVPAPDDTGMRGTSAVPSRSALSSSVAPRRSRAVAVGDARSRKP